MIMLSNTLKMPDELSKNDEFKVDELNENDCINYNCNFNIDVLIIIKLVNFIQIYSVNSIPESLTLTGSNMTIDL